MKMLEDGDQRLRIALGLAVVAIAWMVPDLAQAGGLTNWEGAAEQVTQEAESAGNAMGPLILIGLGLAVFYGFNQIVGQGLAALGSAAIIAGATALWAGLGFAGGGGGSIFDVKQTVVTVGPAALNASGLG